MNTTLTWLKKPPFAKFMLLAVVLSLVVFEILTRWIDILSAFYSKPNLGYHELPAFIHYIEWSLPWVILVALAVILALDIRKRNFIRTSGFIIGLVLAYVIIVALVAFRYSVTMSDF